MDPQYDDILPSAYKHGVSRADIDHALAHPVFMHDPDDRGCTMIVGGRRDGHLIEIGIVETSDGLTFVIHAQYPARNKYLRQ